MKKLKIYDDQFPHAHTMGNGGLEIKSKHFEWSRSLQGAQVAFVTESWFNRLHLIPEKFKVAILIESKAFVPHTYEWIRHNYHLFDAVLTHDIRLLEVSQKFVFYPYAGSWIFEKDYSIYPKSKNVSIVASHKRDLEGHLLRHDVISKFSGIDVYGNGYNSLDYLLPAYKDYRFTIVIENAKYDYWITEKLINPLLCGCVPIYWGCPTVSNFFKEIITFNNTNDLNALLSNIDYEKEYERLKESVLINFNEAKKYTITEDWIWENAIPILTGWNIPV